MIPTYPEWLLKVVFALAGLGIVSILIGVVAGIIWLINHVRIV